MTAFLALLACSAPSLEVSAPDLPQAGVVALSVHTEAPQIWLSVDGAEPTPHDPGSLSLDTSAWPDGEHPLTITARTLTSRTAEASAILTTDNTGPTLSLSRRSRTVEQGHTLPIVVATDEPATVEIRFQDQDRTPFAVGEQTWRALVGVPIRTEAGPTPLSLVATDRLGNRTERQIDVQVIDVDWPFTGKLPMSRRQARVDPPAMVVMREERDAVYAAETPVAMWSGTLSIPVADATRTSPFGTFREYPDGKRSFHDAEDLSRKPGTPIYAAATGTVALAHMQEVHGNAVLVDHGQKVVTLYSHMRKLNVEAGQPVAAGDLLGWIGSTGRSTGPHLHWGIVVDEVAVDPMQWVEASFEGSAFDDLEPL